MHWTMVHVFITVILMKIENDCRNSMMRIPLFFDSLHRDPIAKSQSRNGTYK